MFRICFLTDPPTADREPLPPGTNTDPEVLRNLTRYEGQNENTMGFAWYDDARFEPPQYNPDTHTLDGVDQILEINTDEHFVRYTQGKRELTPEELEERILRAARELADAKRAKLAIANQQCDIRINALTSTYPATEVLTFSKQETEARAYQANAAAATPMIDALSINRGIDKAELTGRIIAKADLFAQYTGMIVGYRQALEDAINAATTAAAVAAIDATAGWPA